MSDKIFAPAGTNEANSAETETDVAETAPALPNELAVLKQRAKLMGISFSNNIGIEALREKVNAKMADAPEPNPEPAETAVVEANALNPLDGDEAGKTPKTKKSLRKQLLDEATKLVRVRIQNLDPKKANLPGEIFAVGNRYIGTIKKFIPYGEVTDNGYHIPFCLYQELESRRFQHIRTTKDRRTGQIRVDSSWAKEFALEILPPLSPEELARLANAQAAAGSID